MLNNSNDLAVRYLAVDASSAGQRLDNYLVKQLKGVPKSAIYRIIRRGEVRVNRRRAKPTQRLADGDAVRIPPVRVAAHQPISVDLEVESRVGARLPVIYEDPDLLVIDKPAGLAVHGGSRVTYGLIESLRASRPDSEFLELVHRLDKETSGCLVIAKRRPALVSLQRQWREGGRVHKHYRALACGRLDRLAEVDVKLARHPSAKARNASSLISPLQTIDHTIGDFTLVDISLRSGRMHQARQHARAIGHPIAGDTRYGDFSINKQLRQLGLKRLFLHAMELIFDHPVTARPMHINSPLAADLNEVLERLGARR